LSWFETWVKDLQHSGLRLLIAYVLLGLVIFALQLPSIPGIFLMMLAAPLWDSRARRHGALRVAGDPQDDLKGMACAPARLLRGRIRLAPRLDTCCRGGSRRHQCAQRGPPVTNIRNTTSPHWRGWLKPENRWRNAAAIVTNQDFDVVTKVLRSGGQNRLVAIQSRFRRQVPLTAPQSY
jgi:hypothetical protein